VPVPTAPVPSEGAAATPAPETPPGPAPGAPPAAQPEAKAAGEKKAEEKKEPEKAHVEVKRGQVVILSSADMMKNDYLTRGQEYQANVNFFKNTIETFGLDQRLLQIRRKELTERRFKSGSGEGSAPQWIQAINIGFLPVAVGVFGLVHFLKRRADSNAYERLFAPLTPERRASQQSVLFSFQGRIGRATFWGLWISIVVINIIVGAVLQAMADRQPMLGLLVLLWLPPAVWVSLAMQVKRWHDRNKSGWMILINFIPIIGWIWAMVELGILKGTTGSNQYGEDPLLA